MLSLPMLPALLPLSMLFGTLAVGNGLTALDAILMSAFLFAGASQFVAIDLYNHSVPAWSILLSVLALNFRHVLYSAALTHVLRPVKLRIKIPAFFLLADPMFAITDQRAGEGKPFSAPLYFGLAVTLYSFWVLGTVLGALFGKLISDPQALALDMLMPIYFLTLVMSFRTRPNWGITVVVSAVLSILTYYAPAAGLTWPGPPWHITIGGLGGILTAVLLAPTKPGMPKQTAPDPKLAPHHMNPVGGS